MEDTIFSGGIIETLIRRGWCFRDVEEVKGLIQIHIATTGEMGSADSVESELLNMDLRSIGGKSLPDSSAVKKLSHLQGPKVLQIVSVKDIYQSSIEGYSRNSHNPRLFRLGLTDGHSEIIAIEYSPIPSIADDIAPGTKVRLENRAAIHSGILCLNSKVITVLGGIVQSLYEEWQMSRKYSGFSRSSLRLSQKDDGGGPPPFEKLQIEARPHQFSQPGSSSYSKSTSKTIVPSVVELGENSGSRQSGRNQSLDLKADKSEGGLEIASLTKKAEEKPSNSESRPKEVAEAVPVQNQAAAQKLLQKMSQPGRDDKHFRGPKYRGKGKQQEAAVFTLDEWERRKGGIKPLERDGLQDISRDEELAWQLQNQLDLEDFHAKTGHETEADKIRMNMFNFKKMDEGIDQGRTGFRGRGRGRGRGKRRFG